MSNPINDNGMIDLVNVLEDLSTQPLENNYVHQATNIIANIRTPLLVDQRIWSGSGYLSWIFPLYVWLQLVWNGLSIALYEVHGFETPACETWSANCFSACSSFAASVLYESGYFLLNSLLL
jgi:hypothetical protein